MKPMSRKKADRNSRHWPFGPGPDCTDCRGEAWPCRIARNHVQKTSPALKRNVRRSHRRTR